VTFGPLTDLEIRPSRFGAPAAARLIAAAQAESAVRYGGPDETFVEASQFDPPEGAFLVAWAGGEAVGCGGWRTLLYDAGTGTGAGQAEDVAEIKRMYVVPDARGSGVAAAMLAALEASARQHGMRRIVLETGEGNPEAIKFYAKSGYQRIANFGHYKDEPDCVSFGRDL
jgi:GNAT superfamily N-acetyltransferase